MYDSFPLTYTLFLSFSKESKKKIAHLIALVVYNYEHILIQ